MAIVYRVEDVNGDGPYQYKYDKGWGAGIEESPAFIRDLYDSDRYSPNPHPAPTHDGIAHPIDFTEVFGFETLTQLGAWMLREPEDAHKLTIAGYQVTVYEVLDQDVRRGRRQVVFKKRHAMVVRSYTLHDVAELLPIPNELPG
ncbi:hypothetical protein HOU45_gp46 [Microbacterium phage Armstrong]|uniref:Uncharacterized protein n=1 Tax=Microbacterium phage Armstrong TaxID=2419971 RepID=A0A3G2KDB8_9CAUD|nr:hypothetical protein HOU45_gp46 [Microbacterium phage Armstrong]AYN56931.1 hypothetical protein PBI_ARMSTRONG_46 [Microbacterium phage Armstrong]